MSDEENNRDARAARSWSIVVRVLSAAGVVFVAVLVTLAYFHGQHP